MANQKKETKKKKLKISEKAIVKQGKSAMSGCGRTGDAQCGISARMG